MVDEAKQGPEQKQDPKAAEVQQQREVQELVSVLKNCETAIAALEEQPLTVGSVTDLMGSRAWLEDIHNQLLIKLEAKREYKIGVTATPA